MSGPMQHRHGLAGPYAAPGGSDLVVRRETASQTAGPYVHIGLAPQAAGFDIFANNFGRCWPPPRPRASAFASKAVSSTASAPC